MGNEKHIVFGPFHLDLDNECLWRGTRALKLRPKAFAVLDYLLCRPRRLVTKEELLNAVWPDTFVGEANLKVTISQIRDALDDDSKSPRFIETIHRRGYRFIGQGTGNRLRRATDVEIGDKEANSAPLPRIAHSPLGVVGRDDALSQMHGWLKKVLAGERQTVFIAGEAGIGKTALVDAFARSIPSEGQIRIGRGHCLEHYGTGEGYLPVLEAIGRLCREEHRMVDVLREHAPMWLLQMPSLLSASDRELLSREVLGATRERMLREMGEALEALTAHAPLVLILEDLQWSDYSTLDLISYLARNRHAQHLMLIGTYRTMEIIASGHPLKAVKQELLATRKCQELRLEYLGESSVAEYLSLRFPNHRFPSEFARLVLKRTSGNPLFMVNAVDYLESQGLVIKHKAHWELDTRIDQIGVGVPESIKQMIEKQIAHLGAAQQRTLEAASVAGMEFSALALAAGLEEDREAVEARCDELARRQQFIQDCGVHELPHGEVSPRYRFIHSLYQNVLYEQVSPFTRIRLHQRIGEQEERLRADGTNEMAAELAMHFERGAKYKQALNYLWQASENAIRRFAYQEAVALSGRALELIRKLPDTPQRAGQELRLHITLGIPLIATKGYAASDVGCAYTRARELCRQLGETPEIAQVLWGLWTFHTLRAELGKALEIAEELLYLGEQLPYPGLSLGGHWAMEITFLHMGEFTLALKHFERGLLLYDREQRPGDVLRYAQNPAVAMRCFAAWAQWFMGQPDQALARIEEAVLLARKLSEPHGLAHALFFAAMLHQLRREEQKAQEYSEAAIAISDEHGLALYRAIATVARGWALSRQGWQKEAIKQMRKGVAAHRATGAEVLTPHFLALLIEALRNTAVEERFRLVEEALAVADRTGEGCYVAELYRVKGELSLMQQASRGQSGALPTSRTAETAQSVVAQAKACFRKSIKIARQQKALAWELRAATSMARLYQTENKRKQARSLLARTYSMFTEGFSTADLLDAKALLDELSPKSGCPDLPA